jgi:hypothetical protein
MGKSPTAGIDLSTYFSTPVDKTENPPTMRISGPTAAEDTLTNEQKSLRDRAGFIHKTAKPLTTLGSA